MSPAGSRRDSPPWNRSSATDGPWASFAPAPEAFPNSLKSPGKTFVGLLSICFSNAPLAILTALLAIATAKSLLPDLFGVGERRVCLHGPRDASRSLH